MNKKTIRIISTILTIAVIVMAFAVPAFAANTIGGVDIDPNTSANGTEKVGTLGRNITGIIRVAGTLIAVGVLMVLGIRYMMGSAEEKASYKKTMIPYLVGAALLFAASNIAGYVYDFAMGL